MSLKIFLQNVTIKQANSFIVFVLFSFTLIFVALLVDEIYEDYERTLTKNSINQNYIISDDGAQEHKNKKLKSILIKTILAIVTLSFILFGLFLGITAIFNKLLQQDTQTFLDFFKKAANSDEVMISDKIFFEDFKMMVGYANEMVEKINEQKRTLLELNSSLEERVRRKTADLLQINENLQQEKEFSQELLKSQKEFLRYTVHETNTPLSVILTSIELYVMKHKKDRQLSKIEAAVKNIFSIYDDLSYLVKKDQIEYKKSVMNFNNFLSSRIDFFTEVAEFSLLKFDYTPPKEELHVYFNETKLQRIVDNTLTNAIKYTLPNETVQVSLEKIGAELEFQVSSKSKIIQDTDKVFDAYYREERSRDGFGLGLRLVKSICEEEGIAITLCSNDSLTTFGYKFKVMGE